jgi:hypothetical protein
MVRSCGYTYTCGHPESVPADGAADACPPRPDLSDRPPTDRVILLMCRNAAAAILAPGSAESRNGEEVVVPHRLEARPGRMSDGRSRRDLPAARVVG